MLPRLCKILHSQIVSVAKYRPKQELFQSLHFGVTLSRDIVPASRQVILLFAGYWVGCVLKLWMESSS